ncbi:TPA: response regulator [Burkholderia aenigmatica]|uniref:hybrid sensor histidine kinase/response regulator n=1 Tax=Burkholderia sp. AU45251 TaxID=3059204 RepID=UPI00264CF300|nr:hybrid sensor histidine kinase/response regulator [Burkholderia sp. AU45251]HDR9482181.1 response regulator [Burkholderia aenigmatica]MDN7515183.1 response regulator [Burkholderia sp. AU45251]HDR9515648.1 response regulator [Burkholderia aenigmatica]HDR9590552.1 response regulator [Burkholderia aenigmatica]HDR9598925.1 response regulator [Burkholderia aenigmatica]
MQSIRSTNVQKLAQSAQRLNVGLLVVIVLAFFFLGTTYWAVSRVLQVEQAKIDRHFERLIGNIVEHERFLLQYVRATKPAPQSASQTERRQPRVDLALLQVMPHGDVDVYEGQQFVFSQKFALALPGGPSVPLTSEARARQFQLGVLSTSFYSGFWSGSRYPAPQMLMIDLDSPAGMAVPAMDARPNQPIPAREGMLRVLKGIRDRLHDDPPAPGMPEVHWRKGGDFVRGTTPKLLAYVYDTVPESMWWQDDSPRRIVAAVVLDLESIGRELGVTAVPSIDLAGPDGQVLLGDGDYVRQYANGIHLLADGLIVKRTGGTGRGWQAVYHIPYQQLILDGYWSLAKLLLALLTVLGSGWLLTRWYRQHVVTPASDAHQALQESHAFNHAIIQTAPVALCVLGDGGRKVVTQNALATEWLGGPDDIRTLTRHWHMFEDGEPVSGEACAVVGPLFLHARYAPTQYQGASVLLCAFHDITAHRVAESALRRASAAADAANEAKSRFLATMSHEIRTPLYGVVSTLELLGLTQLNVCQQGYVRTIGHSADILLQLISDILDISKIEADQMPLEAEAFCPQDVADETLRSYAARAHEKGLQLYGCIDTDVPARVIGDSTRIRQILGNLVGNAIKFTSAGRVVLRLRRVHDDADDAKREVRLQWEVVDTGAGMSKAQQARLFEPFYQVEDGRPQVGGTGLGLSICWRLCRLMGGALDVASVPGLGSQFNFSVTLDLPLADTAPAGTPSPGQTIYVRAPTPELTDSVCRWLAKQGGHAVAVPPGAGDGAADDTDLLLELLPEWLPPMTWRGVRVRATHDAALRPQPCAEGWQVNLHCRAGVLEALAVAAGSAWSADEDDVPAPAWQPLGLRVLVAEDNPINRMLLTAQLEQLGCTVTVAANGEEALHAQRSSPCDVVLTDVNMPVLDGYRLASALREQDAALPIIGVTANAMRDEGERCLAAGMNAWLTKPMRLQTLHEKLCKVARANGSVIAVRPETTNAIEHGCVQRKGGYAPDVRAVHAPSADGLKVPALMREVFLSTMREDLDAVRASIHRDDPAQVRALLHRMHGGLSVVGGQVLANACSRQQEALADGAPLAGNQALRTLVVRIESAVMRL